MSNVLSECLAGPKPGQVRVEGLAHISKTMASSSRMHYIYLLRRADNSLYVGETSNLQTRAGLVAIYKDGPVFEVVAIDSAGRTRPDWAAAIRQRPLRAYPVANEPNRDVDWAGMVRRLGKQLDATRRPYALAAIVLRPPR